MDRRETLKSLLIGTVSGGLVISGCSTKSDEKPEEIVTNLPESTPDYGRTDLEKARDAKLFAENFLNTHELETIAVLCDLILPANEEFESATDAGVPEFIDFIVKDIPTHKLPMRGGVMWLDNFSNKLYNKEFKTLGESEQKKILDQIAWPAEADPALQQGVSFFSLMRDLTVTGYFTSKIGIRDLGYKGNMPNVWDGVPDDILKDLGMAYEKEWLEKCIDQNKRFEIAQWDEDGNLLN